jgi:NTP pyrophosphatase (non-canonical NTP hydrolase)
MGLAGEAGEVAEKLKKLYRDRSGQVDQKWRRQFVNELGDVLWYLDRLAADFGYDLDDVAAANMRKLYGRMERQTLHGSGDER